MDYTKEEIIALRNRLGLTQTGFAMKLGVSIRTLQYWETGLFAPSIMAKARLDECLDSVAPEPLQRVEVGS